jgi:hypothetical protein
MSKRETLNIESMDALLDKNDECVRNIKDIIDQHYIETGHRKKSMYSNLWLSNELNKTD